MSHDRLVELGASNWVNSLTISVRDEDDPPKLENKSTPEKSGGGQQVPLGPQAPVVPVDVPQ